MSLRFPRAAALAVMALAVAVPESSAEDDILRRFLDANPGLSAANARLVAGSLWAKAIEEQMKAMGVHDKRIATEALSLKIAPLSWEQSIASSASSIASVYQAKIGSSLSAGTVAADDFRNKVRSAGLLFTSQDATSQIMSSFRGDIEDAAATIVRSAVLKAGGEAGFAGKKTKEIYAALDGAGLLDLGKMEEDERRIVTSAILGVLERPLGPIMEKAGEAADAIKVAHDLARTFKGFVTEYGDAEKTATDRLIAVSAKAKELTAALADGKVDMALLATLQTLNMPPEKLKSAVLSGQFPGIDEATKKVIVATAEYRTTVQGFVQGASQVADTAQLFVTAAKKFNIDLPPNIDKTIADVQKGLAIAGQVASGNYVGAAMAVLGMGGAGGGMDAGEARHQAVMAELKVINQRLDIIDKKLDFISKQIEQLRQGQETIIKNQALIMEAINGLSVQLSETEKRLTSKLDVIQDISETILSKLVGGMWSGGHLCDSYILAAPDDMAGNYAKMMQYHSSASSVLKSCLDWWDGQLETIRTPGTSLFDAVIIFNAMSPEDKEDYQSVRGKRIRVHLLASTIAGAYSEKLPHSEAARGNELFFQDLTEPSIYYQALTSRLALLRDKPAGRALGPRLAGILRGAAISKPTPSSLLETGFAPSLLSAMLRNYLDLQRYYELVPNDDVTKPLLSPEQLMVNPPSAASRTPYRLRLAATYVDVAIAQQAMLGGDLLLPALAELMGSPSDLTGAAEADELAIWNRLSKDSGFKERIGRYFLHTLNEPFDAKHVRSAIMGMLEGSPVLAANLVRWHLYAKSPDAGPIAAGYRLAYCAPTDAELKALFGPGWTFTPEKATTGGIACGAGSENGWRVSFGGIAPQIMPTPQEFQAGSLVRSREVMELMETREMILGEIASRELAAGLYKSDRRNWQRMLLVKSDIE
jgi:hypothetical protein